MTRRMEQVNELLRSELAKIISQDIKLENGLITITRVKCSPNLQQAKIYISILPENLSGTALKQLKRSNVIFSHKLKGKLNLKYIPRFNWIIDDTERNAADIEQILDQIKNER